MKEIFEVERLIHQRTVEQIEAHAGCSVSQFGKEIVEVVQVSLPALRQAQRRVAGRVVAVLGGLILKENVEVASLVPHGRFF